MAQVSEKQTANQIRVGAIADTAFDRIATLDTIMSDYDPGSELTRLFQRAEPIA
jgi:hypothetical protein